MLRAKRYLLLLVLCFCWGSLEAAFAQEQGRLLPEKEAQAVLVRIKESQQELKTISASFVEERKISVLANPLVFSGKVYLEPEEFLFLQYEKPLRHVMKMVGNSVLFFVEGSETADMVDLAGARERGQQPDLFNWSPENFQGEVREVPEGYLLSDPQAKAGSRQVRVIIDRQNLVVRRILLIDEAGDETIISLSDVRLNEAIPATIRNYTLPPGIRINKLNQP